ncbi:MAG: efflux RND transporter periplasmic adaptor subunit [Planctomycetota bacterium]
MSDTHVRQDVGDVRNIIIRWIILLLAVSAFALWATCRMKSAATDVGTASATASPTASADAPAEAEIEYWTCTMHPDVRQGGAGDCPVCGMELVPKYRGSDELGVKPAAPPPKAMGHGRDTRATGNAGSQNATDSKVWYKCTMAECNDKGDSKPGTRCPVCGMVREKIVLEEASEDLGEFEISLSERARRLAEVETEPIAYRSLFKHIRTVGKVAYDETRHKMVSAWVSGRIDKLFADYTGMAVSKGDHLVEIYSPDLVSAQEELLNALQGLDAIKGSPLESSRRGAGQLVSSARRNLELLGITEEQINELTRTGEAATHLVVHASIGGTIVRKAAMEGMYVKTGDLLYEIADLSYVWLIQDLYEADLPWVRPFQEVRVSAQSLPGEVFSGQIVFVDPVVDQTTRTVKVRVNIANPMRRLKPGMFVNAEVRAAVGADARGVSSGTPGAYACPMHPWEAADELGICPICEMDMVPVGDIPGYSAAGEFVKVLSVPRQAVLQTGDRAIVHVEISPGTYRAIDVSVGPLAQDEAGGEFYPVLGGLTEGQTVVTRGGFAIDSQMQIAGKSSLFNKSVTTHDQHKRHSDAPPNGSEQQEIPDVVAESAATTQTICPVMGNKIVKSVFTEYKGVKIYFCCPPCIKKFTDAPEQYIPKLPPAVQERIKTAPGHREADHDD